MHLVMPLLCLLSAQISLHSAMIRVEPSKALIKIEEFLQTAKATKDIIWATRLKTYAIYLIWDETYRNHNQEPRPEFLAQLKKERDVLKNIIDTYKQSDDAEIYKEISKAQETLFLINVGIYSRTKNYLNLLITYDNKLQDNSNKDLHAQINLCMSMARACYLYKSNLTNDNNPKALIESWPYFKNCSGLLIELSNNSRTTSLNTQKRMYSSLGNIHNLSIGFLANTKQDLDFDKAAMKDIQSESLKLFNALKKTVNTQSLEK